MYGITGYLAYPGTGLIGLAFFMRFVDHEPTDEDLSSVRAELRAHYADHPCSEVIETKRAHPLVVESYLEQYDPASGDVHCDARARYRPDWQSHVYPTVGGVMY